MKKQLFLLCILISIACFTCAETTHLTVLHLNDTHGHAWPFDLYNNPGIGGFASVATLVEQIRTEVTAQGGHILVLHAGDINTGVPESDQLNALPDIVAMNMIGFDAMTPGNHEFDITREELMDQISYLSFPMINANIVTSEGKNLFKPYLIKDFGDLKVAIIGLISEETAQLAPLYTADLHFENAIDTVKKLLPELKQNADIIIALTHLGYTEETPANYTTSPELAKALPELSVIVDGHSHSVFEQAPVIGNTIIVQAGEWAEYLGRLDLTIEDGKILRQRWQLIPINFKTIIGTDESGKPIFDFLTAYIPPEPKIKTVLDFFSTFGSKELNIVIADSNVLFDGERDNVRSKDTNLTNFVTDALIWKTHADIAVLNGGTIRTSIPPGKITYRSILYALPFSNSVYLYKLTGSEIMQIFEFAATMSPGKGGYIHTAGLTFSFQSGKAIDAKVKGKPLDMKKTYTVAVNSYLASGGDGYDMLKEWQKKAYNTGYIDADIVRQYFIHLSPIKGYDDKPRHFRK